MPLGPKGVGPAPAIWWAVTVRWPEAPGPADLSEAMERVSGILYAEGAPGVQYEDGAPTEAEWADDMPQPALPFVSAYFRDGADWPVRRRRLEEALAGAGVLQVAAVQEADWAHAWKKFFHAVRPGERIWVVPAWEDPPEPGGLIVRIDPGMAFGTGTHPTTGLMIRLLEHHVRPGRRWLDVGTGSGILALAAWRLGAQVGAVDVDPVAVDAARQNIAAHGADIPVWLGTVADVPASRPLWDGLAANLTADIIRAELPVLLARLAPGGTLLLSGIIEERWGELEAVLATQRLSAAGRLCDSGWVAASLSVP